MDIFLAPESAEGKIRGAESEKNSIGQTREKSDPSGFIF